MIPISSTLEIKTRVIYRPLQFPQVAPQLWVSQTPKLVRAYHQQGMFQQPQVEDVSTQIQAWEINNQHHLRKLHALVRKIITVAKGCGGCAIVKYNPTSDKLVVRDWKGDGSRMLPRDLYLKWDGDAKGLTAKENGFGAVKTDVESESDNAVGSSL